MRQHSTGRQKPGELVSMDVSCLNNVPVSRLIHTDELSLLCVLQTPAFCVFNQNTGLIIW